jgi:hypothetical protein
VVRCLTVLVLAAFAAPATAQEPPAAGLVQMSGSTLNGGAGLATGNMTYHGGPVQHVQMFTIFWNPGRFPGVTSRRSTSSSRL